MRRKIIVTIAQRAANGYQLTLDRGDGKPIPVTGWLVNPEDILSCVAGYVSADPEVKIEVQTDESFNGHLENYFRIGRSAGEFQSGAPKQPTC